MLIVIGSEYINIKFILTNMLLEIHLCMALSDSLKKEAEKPYFIAIEEYLKQELQNGKIIYPPINQVFSAFNFIHFDDIKVVILGQDPYHGPHEANGLAFSVNKGIKIPPSLKNIFKELIVDIKCEMPSHGDLSEWAMQGVLLLNSVLTVEEHKPGSHANIGWQQFTNRVIQQLSDEKENIVFILWGNYAKSKINLIDATKHYIVSSPHPSPFSAHGGFFGSKPFSNANEYLQANMKKAIDWRISSNI